MKGISALLLITAVLSLSEGAKGENSINISYSQTSGNSNTSTLSLSYSLEKGWGSSSLSSQGSYLYKENEGEESANRLEIDNSYERKLGDNLSAVISNFIFSDKFSGYNLRLGIGPGLKVKLFEGLSVSSTLTYVYNNYTKGTNESYYQGEVNLKFTKKLTENMNFCQLLSYQVSFKNREDYFVHSKSQFSVPLNRKLSLTVTYQVDYQNLLPDGVSHHTDRIFLTGVSYNF